MNGSRNSGRKRQLVEVIISMPRLNETEKQEIIRCLEADKPLPEKYRFLLFDDKREVELVWNGKTDEVCNIVLPFQTIEHVDEPHSEAGSQIVSENKDKQMLLFSLDERGRQLKGWTNKLIWGDNKLILSSLKNGPLRDGIERPVDIFGNDNMTIVEVTIGKK